MTQSLEPVEENSPSITAFPNKFAPGGSAGIVGPIDVACSHEFDNDAHFVAHDGGARHVKTSLGTGLLVRMTLRVFDIDAPGHEATPEWHAEQKTKFENLWEAHPGFGFYATRGGWRIFYAEERVLSSAADGEAWAREQRRCIAYLRAHFGLECDEACTDWTRLYRLPRVVRDGERQAGEVFLPDALMPLEIEDSTDATGDEFDLMAAAPIAAGLPRDLDGLCEHLASAPVGTQNDTATRIATAIANIPGVDLVAARALFVEGGLKMQNAPDREVWRADQLGDIFDRQSRFARENPLSSAKALTDLGNAERFVAQHAGRVRYCHARRKWLVWDGSRWAWDDDGAVIRLAADTVRAMLREASEADDPKVVAKWAIASQSHQRIGSMLELAKSFDGIPVSVDELDSKPALLHCTNGTLDLGTFELRAHDPRDLLTRSTGLEFDPHATSELWNRVLAEAVGGDQELAVFLSRLAGYALLGEVLERAFFFLFGPPGTAKSTIIDAFAAAFGEYHVAADFETWLQRPSHSVGGNRGDLVRLAGARVVTSVEVEPGRRFDAALIKRVTGGDVISAAAKYENEVSFRPSFVLLFAANDAPHVRDDDDAMWVRMRRVPLTHKVARPDPNVRVLLKQPEHARAVLAWAVQGLRAYLAEGLGTCAAVERSNLEYRADMDLFGRFLEEAYAVLPGAKVAKRELRESFSRWLRESGQRYQITDREISKRMEARGFTSLRSNGVRYWGGLGPVGSWPGLGARAEGASDAN